LALKLVKLDFQNNSYNYKNKEYQIIHKLNIQDDPRNKNDFYLSEQHTNNKQV